MLAHFDIHTSLECGLCMNDTEITTQKNSYILSSKYMKKWSSNQSAHCLDNKDIGRLDCKKCYIMFVQKLFVI